METLAELRHLDD